MFLEGVVLYWDADLQNGIAKGQDDKEYYFDLSEADTLELSGIYVGGPIYRSTAAFRKGQISDRQLKLLLEMKIEEKWQNRT